MNTTERFQQRRIALTSALNRPVFLMGNGSRPRNLPMSSVPFRQDSTFLYFTGIHEPNYAVYIETDGTTTLFGVTPPEDDALWHGASPTLEETAISYGLQHAFRFDAVETFQFAKNTASIAVPDYKRTVLLNQLLGCEFSFGETYGDLDLVDQIISMRIKKDAWEVSQMQRAADHSVNAHLAVMGATQAGVHERELAALFQGVLSAKGCALGYPTILTVQGDILHQFRHENVLTNGALLLIDGGGEVETGYGVDITRTYPVSGTFNARQSAVYDAVLDAQKKAIAQCTPGTSYRQVHDTASRVIAEFLHDENLISCSPDNAVELGVHALFFPHGVGHHLGMDVHDMENFGDRPSYPPGMNRPDQFGTRYLRLNLPIEAGWIVTVEPGFYIVDEILKNDALLQQFRSVLAIDALESWKGFGGIRIEDDIHVTHDGPEVLTAALPKERHDIEAIVGQGVPVAQRLG